MKASNQFWQNINLMPHQEEAIFDVVNYFSDLTNDDLAFLVKMPTGAGKTGVISVISQLYHRANRCLVVCPSIALRNQLENEISSRFWNKVSFQLPIIKPVFQFVPCTLDKELKKVDKEKFFVCVATIDCLQWLKSNNVSLFTKFKSIIDFVIFDEGHREPAPSWGEVIRSFKKPTLLLSATPYRNDLNLFNTNNTKFFFLSHQKAINDGIIKNVEFERLSSNNIETFVSEVVSFYKKKKAKLIKAGIKHPKVIIRCSSDLEVELIVKQLNEINETVIGIHHEFSNIYPFLSSVPSNISTYKEVFWVHQNKLIEGIDCDEFCILSIYSNFSNSRSLIQQIGRIVRKPINHTINTSYVLSSDSNLLKSEWESYLLFDKPENQKHQLNNLKGIVKQNISNLPDSIYYDNKFRSPIDLKNPQIFKQLNFKLTANIYKCTSDILSIGKLVQREWIKKGYLVENFTIPDKNSIIIIYISIDNSKVLSRGLFLEYKLGFSILSIENGYLFFYDSQNNTSKSLSENYYKLYYKELLGLFNQKKRYSKITLLNSDLGINAIRAREISASSLEQSASSLSDHLYFSSRVEGYIKDSLSSKGKDKRRYVGFKNSKLNDPSSKNYTFKEFKDWVKEISLLLNSTSSSHSDSFFNRFAKLIDTPSSLEPVNILLDLTSEDLEKFELVENGESIYFEELCIKVENFRFAIIINHKQYDVSVLLKNNRFSLSSPKLDQDIRHKDEEIGLVRFLNLNESFRFVLEGNSCIYAFGNYFSPKLNLRGSRNSLDLINIFISDPQITTIESEKGDHNNLIVSNETWHKDTLFALIANQGNGYGKNIKKYFGFDYLICDDMDTEIADFIGIDSTNNRIVLIHAKAPDSKLSASKLQDVCGQAVKNLDYVSPYFEFEPIENIKKWSEPWKSDKVKGTISNRIIKAPHGVAAKSFWNKYKEILVKPNCKKEVWVFLGNGFDKDKFEKILDQSVAKYPPELVQIVYLLRSTWNAVTSMGAEFKIFC